MEYLALIYADESAWEAIPDEERSAVYDRYRAFAEQARAAGVLVDGDELAPARDATTVRTRDGQVLVVDGPYAEVRESLGGFFLLDCADFGEAVEWAARIPGAEYGAVEVRPVHVDGGEAS